VKTTVWNSAVTGIFNAGQGLALGITFCGTAAASAILPPLATWLIAEQGWRAAYVWLGLGWGGVTFIVCLLFLHDAHARRRAVVRADPAAPAAARPDFDGLTIPQAWRSSVMWRIAISTFVMMALTLGLTLHQIAILTEAGVTPMQAAWLAGLAGIAGIAGKLITGVLLDRFRGNWVGGLTLGASTFAFLLLLDGIASTTMIVIAMLFNGYTQGAKLQINGYLTARHAGQKNFGAIYGFMNAVVAAGSAIGPLIAGLAWDMTGNYGVFLIAGTVLSVLCGLLIVSLPGYPRWKEPQLAPA
jgi:predicted MFS family arabinose efflux permease